MEEMDCLSVCVFVFVVPEHIADKLVITSTFFLAKGHDQLLKNSTWDYKQKT